MKNPLSPTGYENFNRKTQILPIMKNSFYRADNNLKMIFFIV